MDGQLKGCSRHQCFVKLTFAVEHEESVWNEEGEDRQCNQSSNFRTPPSEEKGSISERVERGCNFRRLTRSESRLVWFECP